MLGGVNVIQSLDLDSDALQCMANNPHYFSHNVICSDIKDITVLEQPVSDIIVGTYHCTRYSAIADIHGMRTGDDLFLHFFRHIAIEVFSCSNNIKGSLIALLIQPISSTGCLNPSLMFFRCMVPHSLRAFNTSFRVAL